MKCKSIFLIFLAMFSITYAQFNNKIQYSNSGVSTWHIIGDSKYLELDWIVSPGLANILMTDSNSKKYLDYAQGSFIIGDILILLGSFGATVTFVGTLVYSVFFEAISPGSGGSFLGLGLLTTVGIGCVFCIPGGLLVGNGKKNLQIAISIFNKRF